jgi:YHS domain-containing protein
MGNELFESMSCYTAVREMKKLIPTLALISFAVMGAYAKPPASAPKTIKCPVMPTMDVDIAKATKSKMYADYKGRRYFFCCPGCPPAFKANPAKFAKGPSIPLPKKAKVKA